uniref:Cyclin N-terminal domain-containing protein n=1 Tax=Ascaris lumbricoides TaxID=6252 RepID=A0A0M3HSR2_ASCLU
MDKQGIEKLGALLGGCTKQLLICELAFLKGLSFEFQRDSAIERSKKGDLQMGMAIFFGICLFWKARDSSRNRHKCSVFRRKENPHRRRYGNHVSSARDHKVADSRRWAYPYLIELFAL